MWGRLVGSVIGVVTAGPIGLFLGNLTGALSEEVLKQLFPDIGKAVTDAFGNAVADLSKDRIKRLQETVGELDPTSREQINVELQTAFHDAVCEALYDLGGRRCFPKVWKTGREVPSGIAYPTTAQGNRHWREGSPLAEQVCECFHHVEDNARQRRLLPHEPVRDQSVADASAYYLRSETSQDLANRFCEQFLDPQLAGFRSLMQELPDFESHLREHMLDRVLVHFEYLLKQRTTTWRAFSRLLLQGLRDDVGQLESGQRAIMEEQRKVLERLDELLDVSRDSSTDNDWWAGTLAELMAAFGRLEKKSDERLGEILSRVGAQHEELLEKLNDAVAGVRRVEFKLTEVGADVQEVFHVLGELLEYVRGASVDSFDVQGGRVVTRTQRVPAMLRERQISFLEHHRLFAGRSEETDKIRGFLRERQCGYVFVTGLSGYGKTALLANLVWPEQERYAWYFVNRLAYTHRRRDFLRQMCEQLLAYYQMPVRGEADLPTEEDRLEALYFKLLRMPLVREDRPLVVIIDGIDEAEGSFLVNDRYFPRDLPDGKFVIFSARSTGEDYVGQLGIPREDLLPIELEGLDETGVGALLQKAGGDAAGWADDPELVAEVQRVSKGDPFYLHFLVMDIAQGRITESSISQQPSKLETYLDGWWKQVVGPVHGDKELRDLMGILMVALGPLPSDDIFAIFPDLVWGFDKMIEPVRRFVIQSRSGVGQDAYALSHPRFQEYLTKHKLRPKVQAYRQRLLDYCAGWQDHHSHYALRYYTHHLKASGRVDDVHDLLALESEDGRNAWYEAKDAAGYVEGYIDDVALAWELARKADVDTSGNHSRRSMSLQIRYVLVLSSLNSLTRKVPPAMLVALVERGEWTLPKGVAYAIQVQDVTQRAEAMVGLLPLIGETEREKWFEDTLAAVQDVDQEYERGRLLSSLVTRLKNPKSEEQLRSVLRELTSIWDAETCARVLEEILQEAEPYLTEALLGEAFDIARGSVPHGLHGGTWKALMLARLVYRLPGKRREEARRLAIATAEASVVRSVAEAYVFGELAKHEPLPDLEPSFHDALDQALAERDVVKADALTALIPHLSGLEQEWVLKEALSAIGQIIIDKMAVERLTRLASQVPPQLREQVLSHAQNMRKAIWRIKALARLAPYFQGRRRAELVEQVVKAPRAHQDHFEFAKYQGSLARYMSPSLRESALRVALSMEYAHHKVAAIARLVPWLSPQQQDTALAEALAVVKDMRDDFQLKSALTALAPLLSTQQLKQAQAVAQAIRDGCTRAFALSEMVVHLRGSEKEQACRLVMAATHECTEDYERAHGLGKLARHLPVPLWNEFRCLVAEEISVPIYQVEALARVAPGLPSNEQEEAFEDVRGVLEHIRDAYDRIHALAAYAEALGSVSRCGAAEAATLNGLRELDRVEHVLQQVQSLIKLRPFLPESHWVQALRQVIDVAIESARYERALELLAPYVPKSLLGKIMLPFSPIQFEDKDFVRAYDWGFESAESKGRIAAGAVRLAKLGDPELAFKIIVDLGSGDALADIARYLGAPLTIKALGQAVRLPEDDGRDHALTELCLRLAELGDPWGALRRTRLQITDLRWRVMSFSGIGGFLDEEKREEVFREVLQITSIKDDRRVREAVIRYLGPQLAKPFSRTRYALDTRSAYYNGLLESWASLERRYMLPELVRSMPVLEALEHSADCVPNVYRAVGETGKWWP